MITLKIDGHIADIDNDTAIGLTISGFDFSEPGNVGLNYSNSFTIPATANNDSILGFADMVCQYTLATGGKPYGYHVACIYIDGIMAVRGKLYVDSFSGDRYSVSVVDSREVYDDFEGLPFISSGTCVTSILADYVNDKLDDAGIDDYDDVISWCSDADNEVWIPYSAGSLFHHFPYEKVDSDNISSLADKYEEDGTTLEDYNVFTTEYISGSSSIVGNYKGNHFYFSAKQMLSVIYDSFGLSITIPDDMPDDFVMLPDMIIYHDGVNQKYRFAANSTYRRSVTDDGSMLSEKNFLDFVKMYISEYCLVVDSYYDSVAGKYSYVFHPFSGIDSSDIIELKQTAKPVSVSYRLGIPRESWICYSTIGSKSDPTNVGGRKIESINISEENGGQDQALFTIDRYLASYLTYVDNDNTTETKLLAANDTDICQSFVMVRKGDLSPYTVTVQRYNSPLSYVSVSLNLYNAVQATVGTQTYWDKYAAVVYSPVKIKVGVAIDAFTVSQIRQYSRVRLSGTPGLWYITSLPNFNPSVDVSAEIEAVLLR